MNQKAGLLYLFMIIILSSGLPSCKAKTCDGQAGVSDSGKSRKRVKNIGLFSKREMRRKRWR